MKDKLCTFRRIDNLGRVVIPKNICKSASINAFDMLKIVFDEDTSKIIICKEDNNFIRRVFNDVLKNLALSYKIDVVVTDTSRVLEYISTNNNFEKIKNSEISFELIKLIQDYEYSNLSLESIAITTQYQVDGRIVFIPIKDNCYNTGSALIISERELDKNLINYVTLQLTK